MAEDFKRGPHDSLIEKAIAAKGPGYSEVSARTFRTDGSPSWRRWWRRRTRRRSRRP